MLGKLARYLRMSGYDTDYPPVSDDPSLLALTRREGRILLTRDSGIASSASASSGRPRVVEMLSDEVVKQMRQLVDEGWVKGIYPPRCPACNTLLADMALVEARHLLHPFTLATQTAFLYCPGCNILLWEGTHWMHFQEIIGRIFRGV
jgi:hypothetical protein